MVRTPEIALGCEAREEQRQRVPNLLGFELQVGTPTKGRSKAKTIGNRMGTSTPVLGGCNQSTGGSRFLWEGPSA